MSESGSLEGYLIQQQTCRDIPCYTKLHCSVVVMVMVLTPFDNGLDGAQGCVAAG